LSKFPVLTINVSYKYKVFEIQFVKKFSFFVILCFLTSPPAPLQKERGAIHLKIKILGVIISPSFQGGEQGVV